MGVQGDLSTLAVSGDAVSYAPAAPATPVMAAAPAPKQPAYIATNAQTPASAPVQTTPDQIQWVSVSVGHIAGQSDSYVTISMTGGSFVVSNTPSAQPLQVEVRDPVTGKRKQVTEQQTFGASSANPAGTAQTWAGSLVPGTYFVGVQGDLSTLSISGQAVTYTLPAPATPTMATDPARSGF